MTERSVSRCSGNELLSVKYDNLLTIFLVLPVKIIIKATWPLLAKSLFVPEVKHKVQILGNPF